MPRLDYAAVRPDMPADRRVSRPTAISTLVLFYCRTREREKRGDEVVGIERRREMGPSLRWRNNVVRQPNRIRNVRVVEPASRVEVDLPLSLLL